MSGEAMLGDGAASVKGVGVKWSMFRGLKHRIWHWRLMRRIERELGRGKG
ncbi:MAG: hypothetical protein NWE81_02340 [Candidatus Bathyarchaeota archaeon]|nr:hypothetical protein [Candidatus Bathyarchaeota archaeon]